jgi:uncharacterized protein YlxW (UPF0749 family)
LDPSYQLAAEAAPTADPSRLGLARRRAFILFGAALAAALTVTSVLHLRSPATSGGGGRGPLEQAIGDREQQVAQLRAGNAILQAHLEQAQQDVLSRGRAPDEAQRNRELALRAGQAQAAGPGLRIVLDDSVSADATNGTNPRQDAAPNSGRVLDRDLQLIVNSLWAAGAEAVAVNGQRLTALSAIRSAGAAILVDFRPLNRPYRIEAIGLVATLQANFGASIGGAYLQSLASNYQIRTSVEAVTELLLPAASALTLYYAQPVGGTAEATRSGPGTTPISPEVGP